MTIRPDPTFHASPKLAMEAPPENFAYTLLLSPDFSKPDALAVIDVKPGSPTFSQIVHTVTMPNKGDEFHHFGWNACSSALSPLTGHAFLERRFLIIPGLRSSRIYIVDTRPDPTQAKIHKVIEPEEVFKKTGYSRPHTVHCGPEGIYVSTLGGGGKDLTGEEKATEAQLGSNQHVPLDLFPLDDFGTRTINLTANLTTANTPAPAAAPETTSKGE